MSIGPELCLSPPQAQEACGPLEIDNALNAVRGLEKDMQEAKASAAEGKLRPLPGETVPILFSLFKMHTPILTYIDREPT